jgi:signal transduction histidine kinase/CheY-like chemotaxis protein
MVPLFKISVSKNDTAVTLQKAAMLDLSQPINPSAVAQSPVQSPTLTHAEQIVAHQSPVQSSVQATAVQSSPTINSEILNKKSQSESVMASDNKLSSYICHELRRLNFGIAGNIGELTQTPGELTKLLNLDQGHSISPTLKTRILAIINAQKETINTIEQCAREQQIILNDSLDIFKMDATAIPLYPVTIDPSMIVDEVRKRVRPSISAKKLQLSINIEYADTLVNVDAFRIIQVLTNLVGNAIEFTEAGGKITIKLDKPVTKGDCTFLTYSVEDTGEGIDDSEIPRLFAPFKQANAGVVSKHGGTGLGLFICKRLVELMGGEIEVKSKKGVGSTFTFTVKCINSLKPEKAPSPLLSSSNPPSPPPLVHSEVYKAIPDSPNGKRILIVDDHIVNQKILVKFLVSKGYECEVASNGKEAVQLCTSKAFFAVLMDCNMPIMDGMAAAKQIRANEKQGLSVNPRNHIIAVSASSNTKEFMDNLIQCGMDDCLVKSARHEDLLQKIEKKPVIAAMSSPSFSAEKPVLPNVPAHVPLNSTQNIKPLASLTAAASL